ncbi:MAG: choice-of-anchor tandem repeat NxxGxxAF-containing protein [bacterium]|jgi:hypothetical protein
MKAHQINGTCEATGKRVPTRRGRHLAAAGVLLAVCGLSAAAHGQLPLQMVAVSSATEFSADGGTLRFASVGMPSINDQGRVVFPVVLSGNGVTTGNQQALVVSAGGGGETPAGVLELLLRSGSAVPGTGAGDGVMIDSFDDPVMNGSGRVAVTVTLTGTGISTGSNRALVIASTDGALQTLVRAGTPAAGGGGALVRDVLAPLVGADGTVAYTAVLGGEGVTGLNNRGLYRSGVDGQGANAAATLLVRNGDQVTTPAGGAVGITWQTFAVPAVSGSGTVVMLGFRQGGSFNQFTGGGLFNATAGGPLSTLLNVGDTAPGADGLTYRAFNQPAVNGGGDLAFMALLSGAGVSGGNDVALFLQRAPGATTTMAARMGQSHESLPSGQAIGVIGNPVLSQSGRMAFISTIVGTGVTVTTDRALWMANTAADGGGELRMVARRGGAVPGLTGLQFASLGVPSMNARGQVIFSATLSGTGVTAGNNQAVFGFEPSVGLVLVARTGDRLRIGGASGPRQITELRILTGSGGHDGRGMALTAGGQVVMRAGFGAQSAILTAQLPISLADVGSSNGAVGPDGRVDAGDLAAFMAAYNAGSFRADLSSMMSLGTGAAPVRDGVVDEIDLNAFLTAFSGG